MGDGGYKSTPIHVEPFSWQAEHVPVMPEWIITPVGAGVLKPLPGAVLVATAGTSPPGVLPRWQLSHLLELGTCEFAPTGELAGITTILLMP